jgi:hypothetical protein
MSVHLWNKPTSGRKNEPELLRIPSGNKRPFCTGHKVVQFNFINLKLKRGAREYSIRADTVLSYLSLSSPKVRVKVVLRLTVGRPFSHGVKHPSGAPHQIFVTVTCMFVDVGRPLWREEGCWSSPAQSFSGPSPAGLMAIFYCLRFETPPRWRCTSPYLYPPGTGWPSYSPQGLGSLFVASYEPQGYGGVILTRLHTESPTDS